MSTSLKPVSNKSAKDNLLKLILILLFVLFGLYLIYTNYHNNQVGSEFQELRLFLEEIGFDELEGKTLQEIGVVSLLTLSQFESVTKSGLKSDENNNRQELLSEKDVERLARAGLILKQRLILRIWLEDHGVIYSNLGKLTSIGIKSIEDLYWFEDAKLLESMLGNKMLPMWDLARRSLPTGLEQLEALKNTLWNRVVHFESGHHWNLWGTMLIVTLSVGGFGLVTRYFPCCQKLLSDAKQGLVQYVSGKFSLANNCKVAFDWEEPGIVGDTCKFFVKFHHSTGRPYPICNKDNILIEIKKDSQKISLVTEFSPDPQQAHILTVKFSIRLSGSYSINILVDNSHIKGSPFIKNFLPSVIDAQKSLFIKQTSTVVCVSGVNHRLLIEPKDCYGNYTKNFDLNLFSFGFSETGETPQNIKTEFSKETIKPLSVKSEKSPVILNVKFPTSSQGIYHGILKYENKQLKNGSFEILVLNEIEAASVQKNVISKNTIYYEGKLISIGNENKDKKIYLSVNSKQLVVKEYLWKLLPLRICTFRLSPNTKLQISWKEELPILTIDDGSQPIIKVGLKDAKIVVATFTHFLLRNIGGSETFSDKQEHFFKELRDIHRKHPRDKLLVKISRENIIESTWKATKGFSSSDWCRNFEISFIGEQGIDWGGLRREWFEQVSTQLFSGNNPVGFFRSLGEPLGSLVHPNPNTRWKSKHYEMAGRIVGKCLYESSLGSAYRQMVKAKFTRSFLAQLIGLRVSYKYFEQDDPELYLRKVKFILENDVEGMELSFSEEEYDPMGKLIKTIDLIPEGSKILVTNENKRDYLNALAQYRLSTHVKPQVDAFLKGLNDIVPDELLSIFDENELELLMCGTSEYSVTELRSHHQVINSSTPEFRKILDWFWTAVGNMTEEEKARLLQFTTGCSQLPPGGFRELSPLFQLTPAPTYGNLPTAHTCFNQLCLPDYDDYEQFEKFLRIAINEGYEGFGLI